MQGSALDELKRGAVLKLSQAYLSLQVDSPTSGSFRFQGSLLWPVVSPLCFLLSGAEKPSYLLSISSDSKNG